MHRWLHGEAATVATLEMTQAAQALATFITALRGVDATDGPPPGRHNSRRGVPLADRDQETRKAIEASTGLVDTEAVTAVWEAALNAAEWEGPPAWIHGDLMRGNLLVRDGQLVGVIDFGCLGVGDPACDLMAAWHVLTPAAREVFRHALDADDASWERGRGWALSQAIIALPYYVETNSTMAEQARHTLQAVLAER